MFIKVGQFIDGILPGILAGKERLNAFFASRGEIGNWPQGSSERIGDQSLSVTMHGDTNGPLTMPSGEPFFGVFFLGMTGFFRSVELIMDLRTHHPQGTFVTVSCDCTMQFKVDNIEPLLEHGVIQHAILTQYCGGKEEMAEIVQGLLDSWPRRTRS